MIDPLDSVPPLIDVTAMDEIELTTQLMIAASNASGRLSQLEVDRILGLAAGA